MKKLVTLIAVALGGVGATAGTAAAAGGWTSVSVPSTGNNVTLLGASARANNDAWAVGQQFVAAGQPQAPAAAFHWNGIAWSQTPTPNLGQYGALRAVSSSSLTERIGHRLHDDQKVRLRNPDRALERLVVLGHFGRRLHGWRGRT